MDRKVKNTPPSFTFVSKSTYDPYNEDKPAISTKLLETIKKEYGINFDVNQVTNLGGSYNLNLLVSTTNDKFVARFYQKSTHLARLLDIQKVKEGLSKKNIPIAKTILNKCKKTFSHFDGHLLELEQYIEKDRTMSSFEDIKKGFQILAKVHTQLKEINLSKISQHPLISNHVELEYIKPWVSRGIKFILESKPISSEKEYCQKINRLATFVTNRLPTIYEKLPRQLIHGDFKDNNIFLKDDKINLITDFDFMGNRPRIDEISLTINSMILQNKYKNIEDIVNDIKILLKIYNQNTNNKINKIETESLSLSLIKLHTVFCGIIPNIDSKEKISEEIKKRNSDLETPLKIMAHFSKWQNLISQ